MLGAGFSRSLGGPLLSTLFGKHRTQDLRLRYPEDKYPKLWGPYGEAITGLYATGFGPAHKMWGDPEDFSTTSILFASMPR